MEQDEREETWQSLNSILQIKCRLIKIESAQCLGKLNCMGWWLLIITNHVVTSAEEPEKNLSRQSGDAQNSQTDTHNSLSIYPTLFTAKLSLVPYA